MTEAQKKLIELLIELDTVCRSEAIPYFLYTKWYRAAVRSQGFENEAPDLSVMIFSEDANRLANALSSSMGKERYLEYMGNSEVFYRLCMAYGRKDSLDFGTLGFGTTKHYGLHINIELLRPNGVAQENAAEELLEIGWEAFCRPDIYSSERQRASNFVASLVKKKGRKKVAAWIFNTLVNHEAPQTIIRKVKVYQKARYNEYPIDWFRHEGEVIFEGVSTPAMAESEAYLRKQFGVKWKITPDKTPAPNPINRIVDPNKPYEDYLSQLKKDNVDLSSIWGIRLAFEQQNSYVRYLREKRDCYWDLLFTCGDRYRLFQDLSPKKEEILKIRESGDVQNLTSILGAYLEKALEHNKKGNALYIDSDLFECLCYVLEETGREKIAEQLRSNVLPAQRIPLVVKKFEEGI